MLTALLALALVSWCCGLWVLFRLPRCPDAGPSIDPALVSVIVPAR